VGLHLADVVILAELEEGGIDEVHDYFVEGVQAQHAQQGLDDALVDHLLDTHFVHSQFL
jgi:hypothetical protein